MYWLFMINLEMFVINNWFNLPIKSWKRTMLFSPGLSYESPRPIFLDAAMLSWWNKEKLAKI